MSIPRVFLLLAIVLFGGIAASAYFQKQNKSAVKIDDTPNKPIEIDLAALKVEPLEITQPTQVFFPESVQEEQGVFQEVSQEVLQEVLLQQPEDEDLPDADRIEALFQKNSSLPFVETIQYKSRTSWKPGKAAWLVDYAAHHKTHLHFIARSINQRPDYTAKTIREGQSFNILSQKRDFQFHLLVDMSRCKMWFYAVLPKEKQRILLKTYQVGLGRLDPQKKSGTLTPLGKYTLGSRTAIFQPKMMGNHKNSRVELIRVFGTRWIPFEKELDGCSAPAKGFGIHGTPWQFDDQKQALADNTSSLGKYESDGCIRLQTKDMEELFAIISTHETVIEIVPAFGLAKFTE